MAKTENESIFLDLQALRKELRKAGYEMEARNRIDYLLPVLNEVGECIRLFVRAHHRRIPQEKLALLEALDEEFMLVKVDRIYPSRRIARRAMQCVRNFNRCARPNKLESFIASVNSYFGVFKRRNAYGLIRNIVDAVSRSWWQFCHYNDQRRILQANEGYTHNELITRKYHLKVRFI